MDLTSRPASSQQQAQQISNGDASGQQQICNGDASGQQAPPPHHTPADQPPPTPFPSAAAKQPPASLEVVPTSNYQNPEPNEPYPSPGDDPKKANGGSVLSPPQPSGRRPLYLASCDQLLQPWLPLLGADLAEPLTPLQLLRLMLRLAPRLQLLLLMRREPGELRVLTRELDLDIVSEQGQGLGGAGALPGWECACVGPGGCLHVHKVGDDADD